jgi:FKBP-type peptidyl-prolyl cis-trans isomerase
MKCSASILVVLGMLAYTAGAQDTKKSTTPQATELKDAKSKTSYAYGVNLGKSLRLNDVDLDLDLVVQGLREGMAGGKVRLTDDEIIALLQDFQRQMYDKATQKVVKVKKESEDFVATNAKKPGVKSTKSGLQYRVIKEGTGKIPKATDTVSVHYRGTLIDGTEFDSSYKRGEPAKFPVRGVIPGWVEALQLMKEGSKWELTVPAALGYGDHPQPGGKIRPGDALIFEVELLKIEPAN